MSEEQKSQKVEQKVALSVSDVNAILFYLQKKPWEESAGLISMIHLAVKQTKLDKSQAEEVSP